jgi:hypothetical protein
MKRAVEALMDRHLPLPGLAAWTARLPGPAMTSQSLGDWFANAQLEQVLPRLVSALDTLAGEGVVAERSCWVFERARIHLVLRLDGAALALFLENRPGLVTTPVEKLLDEFALLTV